jgi:hypothetical protein
VHEKVEAEEGLGGPMPAERKRHDYDATQSASPDTLLPVIPNALIAWIFAMRPSMAADGGFATGAA